MNETFNYRKRLAAACMMAVSCIVQANENVVPAVPLVRAQPITELVKSRLEEDGYTNITLTINESGVSGVAVKGARLVEIRFDNKSLRLDVNEARMTPNPAPLQSR